MKRSAQNLFSAAVHLETQAVYWALSFLILLAAACAGPAFAGTSCIPNPNASGPPSVDACPLPAAALNRALGGSPGFDVVQCTGVTNDSTALAAADAGGSGFVINNTCKVSSNLTLISPIQFGELGAFTVDGGNTLTLSSAQRPAANTDQQIFKGSGSVILANSPYRSIVWWGAKPAQAAGTDPMPAVRTAFVGASNSTVDFAGATLTCQSTVAPPSMYSALDNPCILVSQLSNVNINLQGAKLSPNDANALSSLFLFDRVNGLRMAGGTLSGNRTGLSTAQENNGITLVNVVNAVFDGQVFETGWDTLGSPWAAAWVVNTRIVNTTIQSAGICFDFGSSIQNVEISFEANAGNMATGPHCFSMIWNPVFAPGTTLNGTHAAGASTLTVNSITNFTSGDPIAVALTAGGYYYGTVNGGPSGSSIPITPTLAGSAASGNPVVDLKFNLTGMQFVETNNVHLISRGASGFLQGYQILTGTGWIIDGDWSGNPGLSPSAAGVGGYIAYELGGGSPSVGHPPSDILIRGRYTNEGASKAGYGILIDPQQIANSDLIQNITIAGVFDSNQGNNGLGADLETTTIAGLKNVTIANAVLASSNKIGPILKTLPTLSGSYMDQFGNLFSAAPKASGAVGRHRTSGR